MRQRIVSAPHAPDAVAFEMAARARSVVAWAPDLTWHAAVAEVRQAARDRAAGYQALAAIPARHIAENTWSEDQANDFLRFVLFYLARSLVDGDNPPGIDLPPAIAALRIDVACRILKALTVDGKARRTTDHDHFRKDLALLAGKLLPVGAELIQPFASIPRSLLWRGGVSQSATVLRYFLLQRRGFRDYCAFHLENRRLDDFNPDGWRQTYFRIAALLRLNPGLKGVFGTAWFYDPAVAHISPHLSYIREVREAGGAQNFRYGASASGTANALAKSARRRTLYQKGEYQPLSYFLVWHRRELLAWARDQQ